MLTAPLFAVGVRASWDAKRQDRIALATKMDQLGIGRDERLLSIDAAGYKYWTGRPGVVTPDDPIETVEAVARAYQTRWLVLERDDIAESLAPVIRDDVRPAWIGGAVFAIAAKDGGVPRLALYPTCITPADSRCSQGPQSAAVIPHP
jgi:hypothetical protein